MPDISNNWVSRVVVKSHLSSSVHKLQITLYKVLIFFRKMFEGQDVRFVFVSRIFVWGLVSYLCSLCLFAHSRVLHIFCSVFVFFVLCTLCFLFLWVVHFWLSLRYIYIYISTFSSIRSFHILIDDFLFFVAPFTFCFVLDKTIQFVTQNYKLATFLTNISFNRVFKFFITNDSVECGNNQYLDAWNFRNRTRIKMLQ